MIILSTRHTLKELIRDIEFYQRVYTYICRDTWKLLLLMYFYAMYLRQCQLLDRVHTFQVIPVSGRSAPNPANRSTVLLRSSELGPFSDASPHR